LTFWNRNLPLLSFFLFFSWQY